MRIFLPLILIAIFVFYLLYLAFIKKNLKSNLTQIVYPGLFFIAAWGILYVLLLK